MFQKRRRHYAVRIEPEEVKRIAKEVDDHGGGMLPTGEEKEYSITSGKGYFVLIDGELVWFEEEEEE